MDQKLVKGKQELVKAKWETMKISKSQQWVYLVLMVLKLATLVFHVT